MKITFHSSANTALIGTPTKAKGMIRTSIADSCPLTVRFLHFCPFLKTSSSLKVIFSAQRVPEPDPLPVIFILNPIQFENHREAGNPKYRVLGKL